MDKKVKEFIEECFVYMKKVDDLEVIRLKKIRDKEIGA